MQKVRTLDIGSDLPHTEGLTFGYQKFESSKSIFGLSKCPKFYSLFHGFKIMIRRKTIPPFINYVIRVGE